MSVASTLPSGGGQGNRAATASGQQLMFHTRRPRTGTGTGEIDVLIGFLDYREV